MILYRPVGHNELELISKAGLRAFPPRLPDQPIFYPVLNAGYARQIAEEWNTKSDTYAGYVTRFNIDSEYSKKFKTEIVGGKQHEELWVPAEELEEFNKNIIGHIEVIAAYFGENFIGSPPETGFADLNANASEYLQMLLDVFEYNGMDFMAAIVMNYKSIYSNYAFWKQYDITSLQFKSKSKVEQLIPMMTRIWQRNFPGISLPTESHILSYEKDDLS